MHDIVIGVCVCMRVCVCVCVCVCMHVLIIAELQSSNKITFVFRLCISHMNKDSPLKGV